MMNMQRAPADSLNLAQTENHYITLPDARMPHTPVCNEMYEVGSMNPFTADRNAILSWLLLCSSRRNWNTVSDSLSACQLVVPEPASAFSVAKTI